MIYNFDELSFQILTMDRIQHKEGYFDVKGRRYAAFSFRVFGTGEFEMMNKRFVTAPGDILFIPANMPYKVNYSVSQSIVVHFHNCNYAEAENISVENRTAVECQMERMLRDWNENHSVNRAKAHLYGILDQIAGDRRLSMMDTSFARCVRYVDEHYCDPGLDIDEVCRYGYISVSSLQRAFQKHLGVSPKQYLIKQRMNRALDLLAEGSLSVKEVSDTCGFSDEKYFSRVFKEKFGYPPSHIHRKIFL
ncbi:MAG: helix-turn-helix transcriptional regulator [Clostridia bacterium]|nr:helix-turn-helix transcriptional regulator [Clostridia bacterium]